MDNQVSVTVRPETHSDASAVRRLLADAFGGSDEADLVDDLRRRPDVFTLVAECERAVVGAITFSPVFGRAGNGGLRAVGLGPMAVRPDWQRRGIGSALVRAGIEACRARHHGLIVVFGHADYYPRFGFASSRRVGLRCKWSRDDDHFMHLELEAGQLALAGGHVDYCPEFDRFT